MWGFAARLNLARLTCLLLYSLVFEWRSDEQPQFLAIFSTLTAMGCLHKEYERTCSFSRGAKTPGGKEPTWRKILVLYRQVRRRGALEWTGMYSAGALAIGEFGRSRWRLRRTRRSLSFSMGFQCPFRHLIAHECQKPDRRQRCVQHSEVYYRSKRML